MPRVSRSNIATTGATNGSKRGPERKSAFYYVVATIAAIAVAIAAAAVAILALWSGLGAIAAPPSESPIAGGSSSPTIATATSTPAPTDASPPPSTASTSEPLGTPVPTADTLEWALHSTPVVVKAGDGEWLVGTLDAGLRSFSAANSRLVAGGPLVVMITSGPDSMTVSVLDPSTLETRDIGTFPNSQFVRAVADKSGRMIYVHGSNETQDNGVRSFDVATGQTRVLVDTSPITAELAKRYQLALSPSGNTLASSFCDVEQCHVDVIDTGAGTVRHIEEPFGGVATTDRILLGAATGQFILYDLASAHITALPDDLVSQVGAAYAIDDSHFMLDSQSLGRYDIFDLDASTGETRTVFSQVGQFEDPTETLINDQLLSERWLVVGPDSSYQSILSYGPAAEIQVLDRADGTVVTTLTPFE